MSRKFKIIFSLLTIILIWVSSNLNFGKRNWQYILEADAKGYYAYLPAVFIYHDLNFGFFDHIEKEKYYNVNTYYDYRIGWKNHVIDKYYIGVAVAQMPFFFISHGLTLLTGKEADGYSYWYPVGVNLAAIFYGLAGLYCLYRWLRLKSISDTAALWAVVICCVGTHLFYYIIGEGGMSHVYSFFFINLWLLITSIFLIELKSKWLLLSSLVLGMIVILRPVNGLIVLGLPMLFDRPKDILHFLTKQFHAFKFTLVWAVFCFAIPVAIQMLYYKLATGDWWVYSYGEEGFHFSDPHMMDILFSYKKGLFLYTPICLVGLLLGLISRGSFAKQKFYAFFFFTTITYVLSSWWMWYYGGSFSSRVYIEFLFLFTWPIADFIQHSERKSWKISIQGLIIILIILCQIQTYQYRYFQIHWVDMNKEKYWDVFLRLDKIER